MTSGQLQDPPKTRGVVDIVFLLDITGSMQECIDAVKGSVATFVSGLSATDANGGSPVKDWRMKVCGYRDVEHDGAAWFENHPFVRTVPEIQTQLAGLQASGGGDEPESLLDALYTVANMGENTLQEHEQPDRWRTRSAATRVIIFFTDASFKQPMRIPEASGGQVTDLITNLMQNRVIIAGFAPDWDGYHELASADKAEINLIATRDEVPALAGLGKPGDEGRAAMAAAVAALRQKAGDPQAFNKIMSQLARTVSRSVAVEPA